MGEVDPIHVQVLAALIFVIGLSVVVSRRNLFFLLMGVELMLNAVNLSFIGFSRTFADSVASIDGQIVPLFIIALAAAEACIGLAMIMMLVRGRHTVDADAYASMKE
ncbi:MAG: NADH-quinone oxidoreductase subunit NuoK [Planctomycetota bacterium]|nr:MAG: NADH-quinone oxidoreductase subunit NuoK [Planctomycetota bacterium]